MKQENKNSLPDVFPPISFDINHGKYVDDIDVDLEAITDQLRQGGLTDEEILALPIHFSTTPVDKSDSAMVGAYTRKRKLRPSAAVEERITLGDPSLLREMQQRETGYVFVHPINDFVSRQYSKTLAHELDHAVAVRDPEQREKDKAYSKKINPVLLKNLKGAPFYKGIAFGSLGQFVVLANEGMRGKGIGEVDAASWSAVAATIALAGLAKVVQQKLGWTEDHKVAQENIYLNDPIEIRAREAEMLAPDGMVSIKIKR